MIRREARCESCTTDVIALGEISFMLRRPLWHVVTDGRRLRGSHFLCIGCVEMKLGRKLDYHDFDLLAVNFTEFGNKSIRLRDRLQGFDDNCGVAASRSFKEIQTINERTVRSPVCSEDS